MIAIKVIPTKYKGILFRSRLEARWTVFFDFMGIEWIYEPEGYEVDGEHYLPDFSLPSLYCRTTPRKGWIAEIKPTMDYNRKLDLLSMSHLNVPCILLGGGKVRQGGFEQYGETHDTEMGFWKCETCKECKIDFGIVYPHCPACGYGMSQNAAFEGADFANSYKF